MGKRWFQTILRLSIVVAVVLGAIDALKRYTEADRQQARNSEMRRAYECAAKFRDEDLLKARAASGNINVGLSPFHCANRDFWVAMYEIEDVRKGKMGFRSIHSSFDWQVTLGVLGVGFVATNVLGLLIAGALMLARWIAKPLSG